MPALQNAEELVFINQMGKPEKSCIWSGSGTAVKRDWSRLSASVCQSSHSTFTSPLSALTPQHINPSLRCPRRPVCDDHPSVHTQLLLWAWETPGPWLFLSSPNTVRTSASEQRLSNALLSLRILLVI